MSHTICSGSGAAISATKSHSPFSATASITDVGAHLHLVEDLVQLPSG